MGITDPTQPYFKDGGWHWTGSKWIKGGLAFEYAGQVLSEVVELTADAGNHFLDGALVPAGYIWVITAMMAFDATSALTGINVGVKVGINFMWIGASGALAAAQGYSWAGTIYLVENDRVTSHFRGTTAADDLYFVYAGYAMRLT